MTYHALMRRRGERAVDAGRSRPTVGGAVVVSRAGMRGIVTLAAAFAIPETLPNGSPFPQRDLILLCAFAVVLGTLVLQGLTMKPLIRRVGLTDDDPVGREVRLGCVHAYQALLDAIEDDDTPIDEVPGGPLRRRAIAVARQRAFELRRDGVIGDDA